MLILFWELLVIYVIYDLMLDGHNNGFSGNKMRYVKEQQTVRYLNLLFSLIVLLKVAVMRLNLILKMIVLMIQDLVG